MPHDPVRVLRYIHAWVTGRAAVATTELDVDRDGVRVATTLLAPRGANGPMPAWIVLHGITRPGRRHPVLVRFTRALASTGCCVVVPDVPEWRALDLAPHLTLPTVRASVRAVEERIEAGPGRVGLIGFSFGAPQALLAATQADVRERIGGVVGFGGYCDLERTIRFHFTGEHEWEGALHRLRPDPYGRWIVGANYLTHVPGHEEVGDVARALRTLAAMAGDEGVMSWDPALDPPKQELRQRMAPRSRDVFDLFAPPSDREPDRSASDEMVSALASAARRVDPGVETAGRLGEVDRPVHLLHGRQDHLIPYSEGLRLGRTLRPGVLVRSTVTSLFGHSYRDPFPGPVAALREGLIFVKALAGILGVA